MLLSVGTVKEKLLRNHIQINKLQEKNVSKGAAIGAVIGMIAGVVIMSSKPRAIVR